VNFHFLLGQMIFHSVSKQLGFGSAPLPAEQGKHSVENFSRSYNIEGAQCFILLING
jgi:hypothetical protein